MSRIGITGHQDIPSAARAEIETRMRASLGPHRGPDLTGIGSIAAGADQLFVHCVLELGGALEVVVPCEGYETTFATAQERSTYQAALASARSVELLRYPAPSEEAFMAAGVVVVERCELLIAVWDGQPARGLGGTADVVRHARAVGRDVVVIWPVDARR